LYIDVYVLKKKTKNSEYMPIQPTTIIKKTFMLMRCVILLAFKLQQTWLRKNRSRSNLCTNGVARGKENGHSNPSPKELRRTPKRNGWPGFTNPHQQYLLLLLLRGHSSFQSTQVCSRIRKVTFLHSTHHHTRHHQRGVA